MKKENIVDILLVQFDDKSRELTRQILTRNEFLVTSSKLGAEALQKIEKENFPLVLIIDHLEDMPMQEVSGIIKDIRPEVRVIVISNLATPDEEEAVYDSMADLYMPNYEDKNRIIKAIKELIP